MSKRLFLLVTVGLGAALLGGCTNQPIVKYNPDDFVNPNQVVNKTVKVPVLPSVKATYGIGNDPAIVKAYKQYEKTGKLETVKGNGWISYPYSEDSKPIISCSMYHFCIVQLESGEKLNSYGLGNTQDWKTNAFVTGEGKGASISIEVKPTQNNMSTDMTISTNKRTYLIGLVAKAGAGTSVLRFYYPEETMIDNIARANQIQQGDATSQVIDSTSLSSGTNVDLDHVNFNYKIKGDSPPWRPLRVFDDGNKTYIEMPAITARFSLPVLYLARNKKMQMVNYRYEKPYFVIDGLFSRAWLISGKGSDQVRVEILNQNIQG
ncbi:MAG: hypothetical protein COV52_09740 [Gammaproteobacteria bacterium CG11_big_fil_rev_8_21_14_0_20_46_22]|nr:MAG: hypothetical protein COV52_09740 [Gammaproteobacteria bacterium CG11_big_fil_rev_8_21_14_0_20_46_22]